MTKPITAGKLRELADSTEPLNAISDKVRPALRCAADRIEALEADNARVCGLCNGPMSKNPHPNAGQPQNLLEVGAEYECIPCNRNALHSWANRAMKAERANDALSAKHKRAVDMLRFRAITKDDYGDGWSCELCEHGWPAPTALFADLPESIGHELHGVVTINGVTGACPCDLREEDK